MRSLLGLVALGGMALSSWWAYRIPFFASPDEDVHFDYVVSLVQAGRPLLASEKPVVQTTPVLFMRDAHPLTWHLAQSSATRRLRFDPAQKVPQGYGSLSYFAAVDREAPLDARPHRNPWAISEYPIGYYGLAALWAGLWSKLLGGVVTTMFAARAASVLLFGAGLLAWWRVLRGIGCPSWRSLGIVAVVAFLPVSSFVSSYVQPDNLCFFAVPLTLWLTLRAAASPPSTRRLLGVGLAMALLALSKYHVFLAVAPPALALLVTAHARGTRGRWPAWGLVVTGPLLVALEAQLWISSGGTASLQNLSDGGRRAELLQATGGWLLYHERIVRDMLANFFGREGHSFRTFWYLFGWVDLPVVIVSSAVQALLVLALQVGMIGMLVLLAFRWQQVATELASLWNRGRRATAWRLLVGNPLLNSYLLFTATMIALYVVTANGFVAHGRHWFAVLPAGIWAAVEYAPRALAARRAARWLGNAVLAFLLAFAFVGTVFGLRAIEQRYYETPPSLEIAATPEPP